jgi:hypothetical protein
MANEQQRVRLPDGAPAIEIYANQNGNVVLKQRDDNLGEQYVQINPGDTEQFIAGVLAAASEARLIRAEGA